MTTDVTPCTLNPWGRNRCASGDSFVVKNILVVVSSPTPGKEEEYNRWYTEQHLADVLRMPGFTSAQRFKLAVNGPNGLPGSYLAIYEYESAGSGEDLQFAFTILANATNSGQMYISQAMDPSKILASMFTPITEKLTAS
jgi:hypothetical protein